MAESLENIGAFSEAIKHKKKQYYYSLINQQAKEIRHYYILQSTATLYYNLEEIDSALTYFNKAKDIAKEINNISLEASANNDIGLIYLKKRKTEEARGAFILAQNLFKKVSPKKRQEHFMIGTIAGNIAQCLSKNDPKRFQLMRDNINILKQHGDRIDISEIMIQMAEMFNDNHKPTKAKAYLDSAKYFTQSKELPSQLKIIYFEELSKSYFLANDPKKGIYYFNEYNFNQSIIWQ